MSNYNKNEVSIQLSSCSRNRTIIGINNVVITINYLCLFIYIYLSFYIDYSTSKMTFASHESPLILKKDTKLSINNKSTGRKCLIIEKNLETTFSKWIISLFNKRMIDNKAVDKLKYVKKI